MRVTFRASGSLIPFPGPRWSKDRIGGNGTTVTKSPTLTDVVMRWSTDKIMAEKQICGATRQTANLPVSERILTLIYDTGWLVPSLSRFGDGHATPIVKEGIVTSFVI